MKKFPGYLRQNNLLKSEEYFIKSGWFCQEDGGYVTENNELILEGRCKEIIQVFDRKLYSAETENVI